MTACLKISDRRVIVSSVIVSSTATASNTTAPTQYVTVGDNTYAYRQFGSGPRSSAVVPATFHRHARQLGSFRHRPSRARPVSHPVRVRRHRELQRKKRQQCRRVSLNVYFLCVAPIFQKRVKSFGKEWRGRQGTHPR